MDELTASPWMKRVVVLALLAGLVLLAFSVLQPFIVPVIWACILCYASWPLCARLRRWFGGRRTLAALIAALLLTLAVIVPTLFVVLLLRTEVADAYRDIAAALSAGRGLPESLLNLPLIGGWLSELDQRMLNDPQALREALQSAFNTYYGRIADVLGDVGRNLVKLAITVVCMFFFFRDGDSIAGQFTRVLQQLLGERVNHYLAAVGATVKAVFISLVLCALAQGLLAGIGYWFTDLTAPMFATAVTTLAALIPFVVPLVWGSIVLWMYSIGDAVNATILLLWCIGVVSWVDNFIRPLVISNATRVPFLLVMFGVLGGLAAFGLVGLFVGPAILAVVLALWREWLAERGQRELPR